MNCKKCGNLLAPTDVVCPMCGEPVNANPLPQAPVEPTPVSVNPVPVTNEVPAGQPSVEPMTPNIPKIVLPTEPAPAPMEAPAMPVPPVVPNQAEATVPTQEPVGITPINPAPMNNPVNPNPAQMNMGVQPQVAPTPMPQQDAEATPAKKKSSPIVVALLIIALIAIIAYIVIYLTKPFDKDKGTENTNETVVEAPEETPTVTHANWMNYLLEKNINSVTLERMTEEGTDNKTVTLTQDDLNNLFTKLMNYQFVKYYLQSSETTYGDTLTISYSVDEKSYEVKIANGQLLADTESIKDEGLRSALEESEHTTENEDLKDTEGAFYNYKFLNYDSTVFDEYLVAETPEE